jgi:membrane protein DedA with SNARE-associated domain
MLASLGYFFGQNQELLMSRFREITAALIALSAIAAAVIYFRKNKSW